MSFHDKDLRLGNAAAALKTRKSNTNVLLPIALSIEQAQAYSGFSRNYLQQLIKSGKLERRRVGPNGAYIVRRDQLDAAIDEAFADDTECLERDFRFA